MQNTKLLAVLILAACTMMSYAQPEVYSTGIGKTVFIGADIRITGDGPVQSSSPPTIDLVGMDWVNIHQDTTAPLQQFPNIAGPINPYGLWAEDRLMFGDTLVEVFMQGGRFGTYVACTNLQTGNLLWRQSYNLTNSDRIDADHNIYLRSDGGLELSGMTLLSNAVPGFFPIGAPVRKRLDPGTGQLIDRVYTQFGEGGIVCLNNNGQIGRTLPIEPDARYLTCCSFVTNDGENIMVLIGGDAEGAPVDTTGIVTMPPSLFIPNDVAQHKIADMAALPSGGFVIGSVVVRNPTIASGVVSELIFLDAQGAQEQRLDISPYLGLAVFFDMEVTPHEIIITAQSFEGSDFTDPSGFRANLLILDHSGAVLHHLPGLTELDGVPIKHLAATSLPGGGYLIAASVPVGHCVAYFRLGEEGVVLHLGTTCQSDEDWFIAPRHVSVSPGGRIVTGATWYMGDNFSDGQFEATFSLDPAVLGLVPLSTGATKEGAATLKVYPNPSSGLITVGLPTGGRGLLTVHDQLSRLVMSQRVLDGKEESTLDVSRLANGPYFIRFVGGEGTYTAKFMKAH